MRPGHDPLKLAPARPIARSTRILVRSARRQQVSRRADPGGARRPGLPSIATDLIALAARIDATLEETVPLIERDEWLSTCLREASADEAKGTRIKLGSMRQVCLYFGLLRMRDLVLQKSDELRVFRSDEPDDTMEDLFRHARATVHLGRAVAQATSSVDESAFLAGLLHDVGIAGVLHLLSEPGSNPGLMPSPRPPLGVLWPAIESIHARVGAIMARCWGFSPEIGLAIETHHGLPGDVNASPMAAAIAIAADPDDEWLTDRTPLHVIDRQLALLGLERSKLHLIAHRAKQSLREIDAKRDQPGSG